MEVHAQAEKSEFYLLSGGDAAGHAGKAVWSELSEFFSSVSTISGIPVEVPTVSLMISSGSKIKSSFCEISVT